MAEDPNNGVAYLRALKQFSGHEAGATAAAPAKEVTGAPLTDADLPSALETAAGERFQGPEKRRSPRYRCEGSAELRERGCDVRTWATFKDVSVHGCYVEAQATYVVGTILRMKLEADGVRVETTGNVRVTYPHLGMGISFTEMSAENATQLRELLKRIIRPSIVMRAGPASSAASPDAVAVNTTAALRALTEFFETRQMLMREDFLKILQKSQLADTKR